MLEKLFKLKQNGTDVRTEILAGVTTFMTMAYILAVNPSILSATGMDQGAVFTATALAALIGTLLMAVFANYPFALAPGMGLNAYFAYTVVLGMGYSWQTALTAVFCEGIIFIVLSLTNVREAIFNAIPKNLKSAVSVGIGLFIAFIGLQNAKIVIGGSSLLQLFSIDEYNALNGVEASFSDVGITVLLAVIGILITGFLVIKNIKGNILWGILITWLLGILCQLTGLYQPNAELGFYSLLPDFSNGLAIPSLSPIFGKLEFSGIFSLEFLVVIFAFLFVDIFDTLGTLIGVSTKAKMLDENGKLLEPMEMAYIDVPDEFTGVVIEKLGQRKGELRSMGPIGGNYTRMEFSIPSRGLIGYRGDFLTDTKGNGIMNTAFDGYAPYKGDIPGRSRGSLVAFEQGETTPYGIYTLQDRGTMFISPNQMVYEGMIIGENSRELDMDVNPCKKKNVSNMRSSSSDEAIRLTPPRILSLEQALEYINKDEMVEVTPESIRLRKTILDKAQRGRMRKTAK